MGRRQLVGDLTAGMRGPHHEHRTVTQLRRIVIFTRMQLHDFGIQFGSKAGDAWGSTERARGHDDVVRLDPRVAAVEGEPVTVVGESAHPGVTEYGQIESGGVGLEVVGELVLGGGVVRIARERHAGQSVVAGGTVQA